MMTKQTDAVALTEQQLDAVAGGVTHLAVLGVVLAAEGSGSLSAYINFAKNLSGGQCWKNAALNAGRSAGVAGLEED